ncbi:MAG: PASTA domain-containing protein, partial [Lachnospiraceae bacterium]|nr:PASTA domain-containing protein [Lachnospiraceae bacterium]
GEVRQEYSDSFDKGIVMSQDVAAGSQVEEGSTINFVVSLGSEPVVTQPPVITSEPVVTQEPGLTYTPWPTQDPGGEGGQPAG